MKFNKLFLIALFSSLFFVSCDPEEDTPPFYTSKGTYDSGVLVLNEGTTNKASVSYISFDLATTENNIYKNANNGSILGTVAQSIGFYNDLAYIVVNLSNKIEIVNRYTLKKIATIDSGLTNPRYIEFYNGKGYVTCWGLGLDSGDDYVAVLNLSNNTILKSIPVVEGPEHIVQYNGKMYVSHAGGWSQNNKISILNTTSDAVEGTPLIVGDVPNELIVNNGILWIFCAGNPDYAAGGETQAKIVKMNLSDNSLTNFKTFSTSTYSTNMDIFGSYIYYTYNNIVYKEIIVQTDPATTIKNLNPSIDNIYSMAVKNNYIYVGGYATGAFGSNGIVKVFANGDRTETDGSGNLVNPFGKLLKTTTVGIGPNGFYFNQ